MKKVLGVLFPLVFMCGCATKGFVLPATLYTTQDLLVGYGSTSDRAKLEALSVLPKTFEIQYPGGSGATGCENPDEIPVWDPIRRDRVCRSHRYYSVVPILSKSKERRDAILNYNKNKYGDEYRGVGATNKDAFLDLSKKLPPDAVLDTYIIGCTKQTDSQPETGYSFCDPKIKDNQSEVTTRVLRPNVKEFLGIK